MTSNNFKTATTLAVVLTFFASVPASGAGTNPQDLEELALRGGGKPYEALLGEDGLYCCERTVLRDTVTGVTLWRLTHDPSGSRHKYFDVPAWSRDGSRMLVLTERSVGDEIWVAEADGSGLAPLTSYTGDSQDGSPVWSWERPGLWVEDKDIVYYVDLEAGTREELIDLREATGSSQLQPQPVHPEDDRLLFLQPNEGRIFLLDPHSLAVEEFPTDGQWATSDGIHRLRWVKDQGHRIFVGENHLVEDDGDVVDSSNQYLLDPSTGAIELFMPADGNRRGSHPDFTPEGHFQAAYYSGAELWLLDAARIQPDRFLYEATGSSHVSASWDGRWLVAGMSDNNGPELLHGFEKSDSIQVSSFDGTAQAVVVYTHATHVNDLGTQAVATSSPDGTKIAFNSDLMDPADGEGYLGTSDLWMAVLRPPAPPEAVATTPADGSIQVSWSRPAHAEAPMYWNPENEAFEVAGYVVSRAVDSGGPYEALHSGLVSGTTYLDTTAASGVAYYYVVQAVEPSGLASGYSSEVFAATEGGSWEGEVRQYFEMERAELNETMVLHPDYQGASGDWFAGTYALVTDPVFEQEAFDMSPAELIYPAEATFQWEAPVSGDYVLWARVKGEGGELKILVDGELAGDVSLQTGDQWEWRQGPVVHLTDGSHELSFATVSLLAGVDVVAVTTDTSLEPPLRANADALAPATPPAGVAIANGPNEYHLSWDASPDLDVQHYNVYAGRDAGYDLDNHRIVLSPVDTSVVDWGVPTDLEMVYKVTAVDRFGNESEPLILHPEIQGNGFELAGGETSDEAPAAPVSEDDSSGEARTLTAESSPVGSAEPATTNEVTSGEGSSVSARQPTTTVLRLGGSLPGADGTNGEGEAEADVTVATLPVPATQAPNRAPRARRDTYQIRRGGLLEVPSGGILANDSDTDGDTLTPILYTDARHGSLLLYEDGSFVYLPDPGFVGTDSFLYSVDDGHHESDAVKVLLRVGADSPATSAEAREVQADARAATR